MKKRVDEMNYEEKEQLLKRIVKDLKEILSENRYLHCISTMKKASQMAKEYNEDEQIVMLTAVAHDIAKEMTNEELIEYATKNNVKLNEVDKMATMVLHGKIGADIVEKKYGFTKEMKDAIYYHSTGRANMTVLDKIIFLADKSEDRRIGEDADKLRKLIQQEGLDKAILWDIDYYTIPRTIEKTKVIHTECINTRNDIIMKLNVQK